MTAINILLAVVGGVITIMVVAGMVFLTPSGTEAHAQTSEAQLRSPEQPAVSPEREPLSPA